MGFGLVYGVSAASILLLGVGANLPDRVLFLIAGFKSSLRQRRKPVREPGAMKAPGIIIPWLMRFYLLHSILK